MLAKQKKLIVYNIPQHSAIDFISGNNWKFTGDSILEEKGILQNFHLKPSRINLQLTAGKDKLQQLYCKGNFFQFYEKTILIIKTPVFYKQPKLKINVDIIVLSGSPKVYIPQLASVFNCNQYVFDASNPLWKIAKWKKDCEELHLRNHTVSEQGAFILDCSN